MVIHSDFTFDRAAIESQIEALINLLDRIDGDPDMEDDDEDCCAAHDDNPARSLAGLAGDWGAGDQDDAEDSDEDRCTAGDDGCGLFFLHGAHWGSERDEDFEPLSFCDRQAYLDHRRRLRMRRSRGGLLRSY